MPTYSSPDCPDSSRCQRASIRLNPTWRVCIPSGHTYEIHTLDGRPVLDSNLVELIDPATKLNVTLNLALTQARAVPTNGLLALGLAELAEEAGSFDQAQRLIDVAERCLQNSPNTMLRTDIEGSLKVESANLQRDSGEYTEALDLYTQALKKYQAVQDHKNATATLNKIAEVFRQIGDYRRSAQWYEYSLRESEEAGDVDAQLTALLRLCYLAAQIGDRSALARYNHQGDQLATTVFRDRSKALTLITGEYFLALAELNAEYGSPSDAIKLLEPMVAYYRKLPQNEQTLRKRAFASGFLGEAYMRAGRYSDALDAFSEAKTIAETLNFPEVMRIYARMGDVYEKQGDLNSALNYDRRAAEKLEQFAAAQELPELQLASQELAWGPYENLTRVTFELYAKTQSKDLLDQVFAYHEQARARALLGLMNDAGIQAREGVDPELVRQEDSLRAKISALQSAFSDTTVSELKKITLEQALTAQTTELHQLHDKIAVTNAKYESIATPKTTRLADVQSLLDDDTVLLEYDLGPTISGVGVITKHDQQIYQLPAQGTIDQPLQEFLLTLREPLLGVSEKQRHIEVAKQLYVDLIRPFRDKIEGKRHIVIVPDADLFYLPFEAIINADGKLDGPEDSLASQPYLGKVYDFSYAPSASVLISLTRIHNSNPRSAQRPLLAFGDPALQSSPAPAQVALSTRGAYEETGVAFGALPYSAEEVRGVAAVYGVKQDSESIYLGSKATKKALMGLDLSQYSILHFATHAVMGDQVKWINQPALLLSPDQTGKPDDGFLKMSEIFNLRLNASLVVLSACETARGKMSRGEGIIGLTSAFLFAGSRSVVASLWDVNDESTSLFMEAFYRGLKAGLTKPEALRQARLETMRRQISSPVTGEQESLASPYYWAPFILVGEWN
jgi:CHAT domain-containing protein